MDRILVDELLLNLPSATQAIDVSLKVYATDTLGPPPMPI